MRKRMISALLAAAMALALTACGQSSAGTDEGTDNASSGGSRILIAYFSWSGNTREMASYIQEQTGGRPV